MKARAVSYGAVELKQMEHRYMAVGLTFSVAIHICVIAVYFLKGLVGVDKPPIAPYPIDLNHSGRRHVDITLDVPRVDGQRLHSGGGVKNPVSEYAVPIPVPVPTPSEDALPNETGGPGPAGDVEVGGEPGIGEGGPGGVSVPEVEPPPFVPVEKYPVVTRKVDPVYPELAVRAGLEGTVWVKIWVDREGRSHKVELLKSTSEIFNEAALAAAAKFSFIPAYMNGGPVAVWVSIPFAFRLR